MALKTNGVIKHAGERHFGVISVGNADAEALFGFEKTDMVQLEGANGYKELFPVVAVSIQITDTCPEGAINHGVPAE